jgi:hypothetical protein
VWIRGQPGRGGGQQEAVRAVASGINMSRGQVLVMRGVGIRLPGVVPWVSFARVGRCPA